MHQQGELRLVPLEHGAQLLLRDLAGIERGGCGDDAVHGSAVATHDLDRVAHPERLELVPGRQIHVHVPALAGRGRRAG
jgi:hypothetical protein